MTRIGIVGLGKMGLSHCGIANALDGVEVAAACDSSSYVLSVLNRYTGVPVYGDIEKMLDSEQLDAVIISTPSHLHAPMVGAALARKVAVFCEKPLTLDWNSSRALSDAATTSRVVTQVGYHYRYVGAFQEVKRLLDLGAIGRVSHVLAEAYGPVVVHEAGMSWRGKRGQGGGALYDYGAHPTNLLTWFFGAPTRASGTSMARVFSRETEDEASGTLHWEGGPSAHLSVDWSDESERKMTTKLTIWGTDGKIVADRQECRVYLRPSATAPRGYEIGWNVKYTTELTAPVSFYLRGEEYTAQLEDFVARVRAGALSGVNDFASAAETDLALEMMFADAAGTPSIQPARTPSTKSAWGRFGRRRASA